MKRRKFISNLAWIAGGLIASSYTPLSVLAAKKKRVGGVVTAKGKPVRNVVISDGYSVVKTNDEGRYQFLLHKDAVAVFVSTPSGYAFNHENYVSRHYQHLEVVGDSVEIDFQLEPLDVDDNEHQFIIWADPQVKNAKDVEKMMKHSVPDVKKLVAAAGKDTLIHGIAVGDIVWDELQLFSDFNRAIGEMGIPFFQCLGNHDMDYRKGGDETSDDTFQEVYGPTYYSFNRGKAHYVILDDVRYLGKDREYDGYIQEHQLDWLKKDLSHVPKDRLIILCLHIPVHSSVKNREDLYALLRGRKVHIMSGHTHYNLNHIRDNIFEHNHGTVCGAWWTGPICVDGTPNGYGVYKVKGADLSWHYQATGRPADYQIKVYIREYSLENRQVVVNIWNYDPAWKHEYFLDGKSRGPLMQYEGFDPLAYETMLGPDLPKPRGFAEPHKTKHLFSALVPVTAKMLRVVVKDRFGKEYTEEVKLDNIS